MKYYLMLIWSLTCIPNSNSKHEQQFWKIMQLFLFITLGRNLKRIFTCTCNYVHKSKTSEMGRTNKHRKIKSDCTYDIVEYYLYSLKNLVKRLKYRTLDNYIFRLQKRDSSLIKSVQIKNHIFNNLKSKENIL